MQIRNLSTHNFINTNWITKIIRNINLIKIPFLFLLVILFGLGILSFNNVRGNAINKSNFVADFKTDVNILSETAKVIEIERTSGKISSVGKFGSNGKVISDDEIRPDLKKALTTIIDTNNDEKISNEEILDAGIMKLKPEVFQKELRTYQFNLISVDRNLKKYIIITEGKYAGTVLYNGKIEYKDDENRQHFGLELFN
ncbi:hypothetical protein NNC19_10115 [Clostridium sp. SHJSY1]|nr:hypothetical protein [Clostridium sp. SHJSY1]